MLARLEFAEPRVPTKSDFSKLVDTLIERAAKGQPIDPTDYDWSVLIQAVDWSRPSDADGPKCSLKIIHFLASLASELNREVDPVITCEKLLELAIGYQDADELYLDIEGSTNRWKFVSTPLGDQALGRHGEIPFQGRSPIDGWIFSCYPIEGTDAWEALSP